MKINLLLFLSLGMILFTVAFATDHPAITDQDSSTDPWELVTKNAAFSRRDSAKSCVFQGEMWLNNGYYHGNVNLRDLYKSVDGKTWELVLAETPYDIYSEIAGFNGKLWVAKNSLWSSSDGKTWKCVLEKAPFAPCIELFVFKDAIWSLNNNALWRSTDGENWSKIGENFPLRRRGAFAFAIHNDRFWVMAGGIKEVNDPPEKGYKDITTLNDVWSSADGKTWECVLEKAPWQPRQWVKAESYAGWLWVMGGYDNVNSGNLNDVWRSRDGKEWEKFSVPTPWSARHEPSLFVFGGSLYLVAGNAWPVQNDVWKLTLP
ncbi:MAG: hypothetical protein GX811_08770 [Lentisphaerae bacterium]|jgi:hypothetical protein|nr:hypothetical protein [Lentisphaerota bacterium]